MFQPALSNPIAVVAFVTKDRTSVAPAQRSIRDPITAAVSREAHIIERRRVAAVSLPAIGRSSRQTSTVRAVTVTL